MARNVYFNFGNKAEQKVHDKLIIEALKMYGNDCYYLPRNLISEDTILNEDIQSKFGDAYKLEMYIESNDAFGGDGIFMSKFGLEIRDQITLVVSKRRWEEVVGAFGHTLLERPTEGDLIYLPMSQHLFEIKYVDNRSPFYQLYNTPMYKLTCEAFEYSGESIETGVRELDEIQEKQSQLRELIVSSITGTFELGELVTQTQGDITVSARISKVETNALKLFVVDVKASDGSLGIFEAGTITGKSTGSTAIVTSDNFSLSDLSINDPSAQNEQFETEGNSLIDFSEENPFGEPNYNQTL